jgi:hypothetical protein
MIGCAKEEIYDLVEGIDIYKLVRERGKTGIEEFIHLESVKAE